MRIEQKHLPTGKFVENLKMYARKKEEIFINTSCFFVLPNTILCILIQICLAKQIPKHKFEKEKNSIHLLTKFN